MDDNKNSLQAILLMYLQSILVVKVGLVPVHGMRAGVPSGVSLQGLLFFMM